MSADLIKVSFLGRTFTNTTEEGVKAKIGDFMDIPLIQALGGDLAGVNEEDIVNEIMKGCGSTLPLSLSTQCGNVRMLLQALAAEWLEKADGATEIAISVPGTTITKKLKKPLGAVLPSLPPPAPLPIAGAAPIPASFDCAGIAAEDLVAARNDVRQVGFPTLNQSGDYYEQQPDLASCGRRALNNLLGGKVFDASHVVYDSNATYNLSGIAEVQYPIDLHKVCKTLYPDISNAYITTSSISGYCRRIEYHDINLLNAGLEMAGYIPQEQNFANLKKADPSDAVVGPAYAQLTCEPSGATLVGFIINYNKNHWVALKKLDGDQFKILNSTNQRDNITITKAGLRDYILQPRVQQIIKVLKPADVTYIDPRARLRRLVVDPATLTTAQRDAAAVGAFKADTQALLRGMEANYLGKPEWENYRKMAGILSFAIHNTTDDVENLQFRHFLESPKFGEAVFSNSPDAERLREYLRVVYAGQTGVAENILAGLNAALEGGPAPAPVAPGVVPAPPGATGAVPAPALPTGVVPAPPGASTVHLPPGSPPIVAPAPAPAPPDPLSAAPGSAPPAAKGPLLFRIKIPLAVLSNPPRAGAGAGST
jgi:hypothetical protein